MVVACGGNSAIDEINQLVKEATKQTKAANTSDEVVAIALDLQKEMSRIEAEAGEKLTYGKSVDEALEKYQEAAKDKLKEFGIEFE